MRSGASRSTRLSSSGSVANSAAVRSSWLRVKRSMPGVPAVVMTVMVLLLGVGLWGCRGGMRVVATHSRTHRALHQAEVEVDSAVCRVAGGHGMSPVGLGVTPRGGRRAGAGLRSGAAATPHDAAAHGSHVHTHHCGGRRHATSGARVGRARPRTWKMSRGPGRKGASVSASGPATGAAGGWRRRSRWWRGAGPPAVRRRWARCRSRRAWVWVGPARVRLLDGPQPSHALAAAGRPLDPGPLGRPPGHPNGPVRRSTVRLTRWKCGTPGPVRSGGPGCVSRWARNVGAPSGTRTPNPLIKSQLLCQLS